MPLITANLVNQAYYQDEMNLFLVYGPLGVGKSVYAIKNAIEVYKGDINTVKDHIVFHPKDFVDRCLRMSETGKREKLLIWDDAGLWLFYLEYSNPFVQAVMKYLNVARTNWGAIIFTTPSPSYVANKLRNFPQNISIKIIKEGSDQQHASRPRLAKAYRSWVAPDFRHQGVRLIYADQFSALLPNEFYREWYKPLRDSYARQANLNMQEQLKKVGKEQAEELKEAIKNAATI
jgi:hypothetical protein